MLTIQPPERPKAVAIGCILLVQSVFAAMLQLSMNALGIGNMEEPLSLGRLMLFGGWLLFQLWLVVLAYAGRGWARVIAIALPVLELATTSKMIDVLLTYDFHPLLLVTTTASLLSLAGVVALLLPRSNAWYRAVKVYRAAA